MIRRFLAFAFTLVLILTGVGHIPGFEGVPATQPLSAAAQSSGDAMTVPSGQAPVRAALYDAGSCKGNRHGLSGPCSFDAVPPSPSAVSPSDLRATNLGTAEARPERSWPSPLLRPPNNLLS